MPAEQLEKIIWLGESMGFWIQTGALLISALGAVYVIKSNGKHARIRATIDLMLHQKHDQTLVEAREVVVDLHRNGERNLSRYLDDPLSTECKAIQATLNNYEFIASGVREGAFDETIYKRTRYHIVMKDWNAFKGVIAEIRNLHGQTRYQEFEWLCCRWEEKPLKIEKLRRK